MDGKLPVCGSLFLGPRTLSLSFSHSLSASNTLSLGRALSLLVSLSLFLSVCVCFSLCIYACALSLSLSLSLSLCLCLQQICIHCVVSALLAARLAHPSFVCTVPPPLRPWQSLLSELITYVKETKIVMIEELAVRRRMTSFSGHFSRSFSARHDPTRSV